LRVNVAKRDRHHRPSPDAAFRTSGWRGQPPGGTIKSSRALSCSLISHEGTAGNPALGAVNIFQAPAALVHQTLISVSPF